MRMTWNWKQKQQGDATIDDKIQDKIDEIARLQALLEELSSKEEQDLWNKRMADALTGIIEGQEAKLAQLVYLQSLKSHGKPNRH